MNNLIRVGDRALNNMDSTPGRKGSVEVGTSYTKT